MWKWLDAREEPVNQTPKVEVLPPDRRPVGRPAKVLSLVPARSSHDRATTINKYHTLSREAAQDAVSFAVMAGLELSAAKASIGHGNFLNWIAKNCEFSDETARRYMQLSDRMLESGAMKAVIKELPAGQVQTAGDRKALLAAIKEMTDGHTLQQLYFDFGIMKAKPIPDRGGAHNPYGRCGNPDTLDERARAEAEDARLAWEGLCRKALDHAGRKSYGHLEKMRMKQVADTLRSVADEIEAHWKSIR